MRNDDIKYHLDASMEGGRRGRSGREMAEFRDRYVSTLR